ncbi:MAG: hypothetical protein HND51_20875 [Chloroflexi bacterium]|nr:hypothetical protein [Chloroflexota bacterium]
MPELRGWLLDVYAHAEDGLVVWLIGEDGERYRFKQDFPIRFYVHGPTEELRELWKYLRADNAQLLLRRTQRRDLFTGPLDVLEVEVTNPAEQQRVFYRAKKRFPDLTYYDADLPLMLRYSAHYDVFALGRCSLQVDDEGRIQHIEPLHSRWEVEMDLPKLRVMRIRPDVDPNHGTPKYLSVGVGKKTWYISLEDGAAAVQRLDSLLTKHDPDLIFAAWGDDWLFPYLFELAEEHGLDFNPNRDPRFTPDQRDAFSYFTYGQIVYRGAQTLLFGRIHVDPRNAMLYSDYRMRGTFEQARVTGLPVQLVSRKSTGSGITAMQMAVALRNGIMVPHVKQEVERFKSLDQLIQTDWGGTVYQPLVGVHEDVVMIDFFSMYPSIMDHYNVSSETVGVRGENPIYVPGLPDVPVNQDVSGLMAETVRPLLDKRWLIKDALKKMGKYDERRAGLEDQSGSLKWLLVVCFGYLGYRNARWGRIEAHEAVTAYSRELLLRAKEVAEEHGFRVIHMYVDGLYVQKKGVNTREQVQELKQAIIERTRIRVHIDAIYKWIAFLPSRRNVKAGVPNRFFGIYDGNKIKVRNVEVRRHDTPPFIHDLQYAILKVMAKADKFDDLKEELPEIIQAIRRTVVDLKAGRIPFEDMLVYHRMTRELDEYVKPSPAAAAARQLETLGKQFSAGQSVKFLYTRGKPGVHAWGLPKPPDLKSINLERYEELLLRAMHTVLQVFGVTREMLDDWVIRNAGYATPPGILPNAKLDMQSERFLPMFAEQDGEEVLENIFIGDVVEVDVDAAHLLREFAESSERFDEQTPP